VQLLRVPLHLRPEELTPQESGASSPGDVGCPELLRLRSGVFLAADGNGCDYLLARTSSYRLGTLTDAQRGLLRRLAENECSSVSLGAIAGSGVNSDATEAESLVRRLRAGGWLNITVMGADGPAYTILPHRRAAPEQADDPGAEMVLSRFAVMRRSGTDLLVESPRSWCSIAVHDPRVIGTLGALTRPRAAAGSLAAPPGERLLSDLAWALMVVEASGDEGTAFELRQWSPHELWFHMRSRAVGVPDVQFGRTEWAAGLFDPLPARRLPVSPRGVDLARPDLDALRRDEATLTGVLEERRSIRRHDDERPITANQLGEFLYRAAGVRHLLTGVGAEAVTGPNPSGGAVDELEFYLAIRLADGLAPGLYRYDRFGHRLEHVSASGRAVRKLIDAAQQATGGSGASTPTYPPQVLVLLAARFGRVGWSYQELAYSLILKHVGVTFQTMYCVATAMGLAPCALGAGDPYAFAEATRLDPVVEGTVGEFLLGSRPAAVTGEQCG
jgi:SagB-type dehydrogenase family enzyme